MTKKRKPELGKYKRIFLTILPTSFLSLTTIFGGCEKSDYRNADGVIWNTVWHVTYQGTASLSDSIVPILEQTGKSLSIFDPTSIVSEVNSNLQTTVDDHFVKVYNESKKIYRLSNKEFDPTLSPLITAWGFGKGHKVTSDTCRIDSIMQFVGLDKTSLNGNTLIKEDIRTEFNFSAIAKGFGCDQIAEMFKRNGVSNFLIEIGGEIVAAGVSPKGEGWKVGIEKPSTDASSPRESKLVVRLDNASMATSGNYRNYHTSADGARFAHTISARTGRPTQTDVLSATVITAECMEADALATALMTLGSEEAIKLSNSLELATVLILNNHRVWISSKMKALVME